MEFAVNVGGVWNPIKSPYVNVGGVWQPLKSGWVNVAGTWEQFYTAGILLNAINVTGPGGQTGYILGSLGTLTPTAFTGALNATCTAIYTAGTVAAGNGSLTFKLSGGFSQNYFTTLTVGSNSYTSASATFSGGNEWQWFTPSPNVALLVNGQNYFVSIN
jgi:hypothetical protein